MPGVFGPAQTPTTPVEAIEPLIASCSKYSSSMSATDIVNMRTSSWTSRRERPAARAPSRASDIRSPGCFEPSAGGSRISIGERKSATRKRRSSKATKLSASCEEIGRIDSAVARGSS